MVWTIYTNGARYSETDNYIGTKDAHKNNCTRFWKCHLNMLYRQIENSNDLTTSLQRTVILHDWQYPKIDHVILSGNVHGYHVTTSYLKLKNVHTDWLCYRKPKENRLFSIKQSLEDKKRDGRTDQKVPNYYPQTAGKKIRNIAQGICIIMSVPVAKQATSFNGSIALVLLHHETQIYTTPNDSTNSP